MNETQLTQDAVEDLSNSESNEMNRSTRAGSNALFVGGAVLVGAGLAYAAAKVIRKSLPCDAVARDVHVETSIAIDKSTAELYAFWRDFTNLPLFMRNLESVSELDPSRSHWVARGPAGSRVEGDAEIYNEKENELIAWRSLENADVVNAGSVRFQAGPKGHGTFVRVTVNYNPPAGKLGASLAAILGAEPSQLIKEDLRRLKQIMEAGEIATVAGQTSGRAANTESDANHVELPE